MTRLFLPLLAFALPFAIYALYRTLAVRRLAAGKSPWPVALLFVAGAALTAQAFVLAALTDG